jgi:hypothetical protein
MPRLSQFDRELLRKLAERQFGIVTRRQALACSLTDAAIRYRIRPGGPWQVVLPGIYATSDGTLDARQRAAAGFLYAGRAIAVTGPCALAWHAIPVRQTEVVDVLVAHACQRNDAGFVRLHRTRVPPEVTYYEGVITYAYPGRAVADTVRQLSRVEDIRAVVAAGVQLGKVEIWHLERELKSGSVKGSARLRAALAEVADGVRSVAEGDLRTLIRTKGLPPPLFNPRLYVGSEFLASPDAWWPEAGVAVEVDSRAYHLSPASWEKTLARQARMVAEGILVIALPPQRIRSEGWKVAREIRSALDRSRGALPHVTTVPVSGTGNVAAS